MAIYDYDLDEERFSGYLSQVQLPGVAKPYLIKDYEAREAANQAQQTVDNLFKNTEEEKGAITQINEAITNLETKIENLTPSEGNGKVDFSVTEDILVIDIK